MDRGISDLTDHFFDGDEFLKKYIEIIKAEWTSHLSDNDDGKRSPEQNDMIKRHFPRKVYWPSLQRVDQFRRSGRMESDELSDISKTANFKVMLDTFKIYVERVGEKAGIEALTEYLEEINAKIAARDTHQTK